MSEPIELKDGLKTFAFHFTFPELKGGSMYQSATAKASDMGTAFNRAWKEVKKRKGVRGHRLTNWKISVVLAVDSKETAGE